MTSESRTDRLEGEFRQMNERLSSLENSVNSRFSEVNARLTSLESRMTTLLLATIGIMITGFVGLVVTILTNN
jgi:tetrahydromethanopterin S-methyltransferase subunit G